MGGGGGARPNLGATGTAALGYALTAVDKLAGRRTRDQLEAQVGSLAQSAYYFLIIIIIVIIISLTVLVVCLFVCLLYSRQQDFWEVYKIDRL